MALCGMIHLWWRCLLYCRYICFYHGLEYKLMNIWTCDYDDIMRGLRLLFYSSCVLVVWLLYKHVYIHVRVKYRFFHWWVKRVNNPLPMYPYVNAWIVQVRSLKCNMKLTCLLCYCVLCCLFLKEYYGLREWLPQCVVVSVRWSYLPMYTHTNFACMLQVV